MKAQTLKVPGATLYYETRGSGPALLLIAGGGTDAGAFEDVASFLAHELLPFTRYVPDLARLSAHKDRIVLAGGHDSREQLAGQLAYRPAALLAERFGTQMVDFPGDHGGYDAQPAAFAAKLREVLG